MAKEQSKRQLKERIIKYGLMAAAMLGLAFLLLSTQIIDQINWLYRSSPKESSRIVSLCKDMVVENWQDSRHYTSIKFTMSVKSKEDAQDQLRERVSAHDGQIKDMIRSTVATMNKWDMQDPELAEVKRQIDEGLQTIVGSDMADQILITDWASTSGYQ